MPRGCERPRPPCYWTRPVGACRLPRRAAASTTPLCECAFYCAAMVYSYTDPALITLGRRAPTRAKKTPGEQKTQLRKLTLGVIMCLHVYNGAYCPPGNAFLHLSWKNDILLGEPLRESLTALAYNLQRLL